jgi:hypothetical protein
LRREREHNFDGYAKATVSNPIPTGDMILQTNVIIRRHGMFIRGSVWFSKV